MNKTYIKFNILTNRLHKLHSHSLTYVMHKRELYETLLSIKFKIILWIKHED